jgi:putative acetyltransferase
MRSDAAANRERVLDAAAAAVLREGEKVPIATVAADAGVGVGTLYRHFPTRRVLLAAVGHRSFRLVLDHARAAAARDEPAIDLIADFLERVLADRDGLILPLHGGPVSLDDETVALRVEIRAEIDAILRRGRADGTIRPDVTPIDVIITGALLAQPLPHVEDWDTVARRQMQIYLAGLAASPASSPLAGAARISLDDPRATDVRALLERHLAFADRHSPPQDIHALDVDALLDPAVTFFSLRVDGELLGVGALEQLDGRRAEVKSMHIAHAARGRGLGRAMLEHLVAVARDRGFEQVSLETGSTPAFAPARSLYACAGFRPCGPFGDYQPSPNSTFMTLWLREPGDRGDRGGRGGRGRERPGP